MGGLAVGIVQLDAHIDLLDRHDGACREVSSREAPHRIEGIVPVLEGDELILLAPHIQRLIFRNGVCASIALGELLPRLEGCQIDIGDIGFPLLRIQAQVLSLRGNKKREEIIIDHNLGAIVCAGDPFDSLCGSARVIEANLDISLSVHFVPDIIPPNGVENTRVLQRRCGRELLVCLRASLVHVGLLNRYSLGDSQGAVEV